MEKSSQLKNLLKMLSIGKNSTAMFDIERTSTLLNIVSENFEFLVFFISKKIQKLEFALNFTNRIIAHLIAFFWPRNKWLESAADQEKINFRLLS